MNSLRTRQRVLVVEDDRTSRKLLNHILEEAGYESFECGEGRDALHIAEMNPPRAMLVDIMLPDMKGQDIVQELMHKPEFRFTEFIFLTALLAKKDASKDFFFKVDGKPFRALQKPIKKAQLVKHLANAVADSVEREETEKREREAESLANNAAKEPETQETEPTEEPTAASIEKDTEEIPALPEDENAQSALANSN